MMNEGSVGAYAWRHKRCHRRQRSPHPHGMKKLKLLRDYTVAKSEKVKGRVRIILVTADNELRTYLSPKDAEHLAAAILGARFDLPQPVLINPPKRKRTRPPIYINFASTPTEIGTRPHVSEETLQMVEKRGDVEVRSRLAKEQAKWEKKFERKHHRKWDAQPCTLWVLKGQETRIGRSIGRLRDRLFSHALPNYKSKAIQLTANPQSLKI